MTNRKMKALISIISVYQTLVRCLIFHEATAEIYYFFVIGHASTYSTVLHFCYFKSWKIAKKGIMSTANAKMKKHWRMTESMVLLVLVFAVCWTPFLLHMFILKFYQFMETNFENKFYPENLKIFYFCLLCGFTNSCINLFFFALREKCSNTEFFWSLFFRNIWTESGDLRSKSPHSVQIRENTDQKNSVFGYFSRSVIIGVTKLFGSE